MAGITSDANILINVARRYAQQYLYSFNDDIPVEQLVQRLCDLKQGYTQYGGTKKKKVLVKKIAYSSFISHTHYFKKVSVHSVFHSFMRDTIIISAFNSTVPIRLVIMADGKQRVLEPTTQAHNLCSSKIIRMISL